MSEVELINYCQERISKLDELIANSPQAKTNKYFKQFLKGEKSEITMLLNKIDKAGSKASCLF